MKKLFFLLICLFTLVSCTSDLDGRMNAAFSVHLDDYDVFYATVEGADETGAQTKVYADEQMRVLWNAGDRIAIFKRHSYRREYAFTGADGDNAGGFRRIGEDDEFYTGDTLSHFYAVYPWTSDPKMGYDATLTLLFPKDQKYRADSFGVESNVMVSVTDDNQLQFKNAGAYLSFKFYGEGVSIKSIKLQGNNGEKISGKAKVTMPLGGVPAITMQDDATGAITLTCDEPVLLNATESEYTEFWVVVPPTTFANGITITVTDVLGGVFEKTSSKSLTFERNSLSRMAPLQVIPEYDHTFVPFADANFKAYCVDNFDKNKDREISISEAQAITTIDVCTDDIESIRGIEFMPNLQILYAEGSGWNGKIGTGKLSGLDVSDNIKLKELSCQNNPIKSLDVSKNSSLTLLGCERTQLSSLDVYNNAALIYLYCRYNQLTKLDVSGNKALAALYCSDNPIKKLDVKENTRLLWLYCVDNQLTNLDVSNNTVLQVLACSNNQLTSLDVSTNLYLNLLLCTGNTGLSTLWLRAGQIISDLSYDANVTTIRYKGSAEELEAQRVLEEKRRNWQNDRDSVIQLYNYKANGNPVQNAYQPLQTAVASYRAASNAAATARARLADATEGLITTLNGFIRHEQMSTADSVYLITAMAEFARTRKAYLSYTAWNTRPAVPYDNKNMFYHAIAIIPEILVDSIAFQDITFDILRRNKSCEYDVNGLRVGNGFVNIAEQLCGSRIANALNSMGPSNPLYPLSAADLNMGGFYGMYQYVAGNSSGSFYCADGSEYVPSGVVGLCREIAKAVAGLNALWKRFWGDDLAASSDEKGNVTIPELDDRYNPNNYNDSDFVSSRGIITFSGDDICWNNALGRVLGSVDPNRSDSEGQSFNNSGYVYNYTQSPTNYAAIFFGKVQRTDFYDYMKAWDNVNRLLYQQ